MKSTWGNAGKPQRNFHPVGEFGNIGRRGRSSAPALVLLGHGLRAPGVCAAGADPEEDLHGENLPVLVGALPGFGDGGGAVAAGAAGLRLSFLL